MSKPFDSQDEGWAEDELRRACAEVDGHIPDGYFDAFSSRLAAKLEMESMETETNDLSGGTRTPALSQPPSEESSSEERDEHSGLHEIKALASSARARITRRRTTESDIEESLLASSSSGLPAVVLPDPERSTPQMEVISASTPELATLDASAYASTSTSASTAGVAATSSAFGAGVAERSQPKSWLWLVGGAGVLAAAAVVAVLVLQNGGGDKAASVAAGENAAASADKAPASASNQVAARTATEKPSAEPQAAVPMVAPLGGSAGAETESEATEGLAVAAPPADDADGDRSERTRKGKDASREMSSATGSTSDDQSARDKAKAKAEKAAKLEAEKAKKAKEALDSAKGVKGEGGKSEGGNGDIDSILDEVTGGPSPKEEAEEEKKGPDKKRIGSSDVKKAMGGIRGRVNKCGAKTGFTGRVSMRFSVAPSGKVTKAKAKTSDAKVARCVESAVKSARFPSFEPPSMSFSYPFLITD